jgi:HNH endonuclease
MPTCIYCGFSGRDKFAREHVIPYAFGRFQYALTLGCVCGECNHYFSKYLDSEFASESAESIVRFRHGLRDAESAERTRTVRAKANIPGPILGAKVLLRPDASAKSGIGNVYVPQVGLKNKDEADWRWYTLEDLNAEVMRTIEPGAGIRLFITSEADGEEETVKSKMREQEEKIRSKLRGLGLGPTVPISRESVPPNREFKTRVTCDFTFNMSRCVAKIAFNYLAYVLGENTSLLLRKEFDIVRKYVRDGAASEEPVVYFSQTPKFEQEPDKAPFVDGHIISAGADPTTEGIGCILSLFNAMSYRVVLCRKYDGVWFAPTAHSYDFQSNEVRSIPMSLLARPIL